LKDLKEDNFKNNETKKVTRKEIRKKFTETYRSLTAPKSSDKTNNDVRYLFRRIRF
jgi:hypothetical protein